MWEKAGIAAVMIIIALAGTASAIEADTNIRLDPHPDHIGFYINSTYITCNFTVQEAANVTIKFEKFNATDNSTDLITDFGEFAVNQTAQFNITATNYSTVGWYRAVMYDGGGDTLCMYWIAVRSNVGSNYEALHGSVRFTDADSVPTISFIENIAGRAQTWTTDSISLTHSVVLWEFNGSVWSYAAGGNYTYRDHTNTSGNLTNWVLPYTPTLGNYYAMIMYSHDGEVLDVHFVEAVIPTSNIVEIIVKDAETSEQIMSYTATMTDVTKTASGGTVIWTNVTNGEHLITVQADGYATGTTTIYMANSYINTTVYLLRSSPYYTPHWVRFVLCNVVGSRYSDVNVTVAYTSANGEAITLNEITGTDGAVVFLLTPTIQHTVTFTNATQGISKSVVLYPKDTEYYIIIGETTPWSDYEHIRYDEIHVAFTSSVINDTHAYINVTYKDDLNGTSALVAYINQTNASGSHTQVMIASYTFTGNLNDTNHSFIVTDYQGQSYLGRVWHEHNEFHSWYDHIIQFWGMRVDLGLPSGVYIYIAMILIIFVGAFFGATTAATGSVVICALGWVFLSFGWLHELGIFAPISITAASVYAVVTVLNERNRKAGYA